MLKSFWFWTLILFILIQFIPTDFAEKLETNPQSEIIASKKVMGILKRSCYDCHSNSLVYPWYDKIAPASWYVIDHVKNGRKAVNFSKWKEYKREKQFKVMDRLPKSLLVRMPLPDYLWLHQEAKLSDNNRKFLSAWAEELKETIK